MSHSKERAEKICLNCNAVLYGRYCHVCGQENIEPKQSAWHLVTHFFYDITHFDGKFFTTLKDLLIKPGFLSKEFIQGRRASYLHPIRMYVFTSAFFFIIFFSVYNVKDWNLNDRVKVSVQDAEKPLRASLKKAKNRQDSAVIESALAGLKNASVKSQKDSSGEKDDQSAAFNMGDLSRHYKSKDQYDSIQQSLPKSAKDGWLTRMITHKLIDLSSKYKDDRTGFIKELFNAFFHNFPKLLFISLPLFALLLELLYIRRRKQFYYADHGIFAIHLYIYSFISLLFVFGINYIANLSGWSWLWVLNACIFLYSLYYYYKSMRNFYGQGRFKTFIKYLILYFLSFNVILVLFVIFFIFSFFEV